MADEAKKRPGPVTRYREADGIAQLNLFSEYGYRLVTTYRSGSRQKFLVSKLANSATYENDTQAISNSLRNGDCD
jgi:hypothetical protein